MKTGTLKPDELEVKIDEFNDFIQEHMPKKDVILTVAIYEFMRIHIENNLANIKKEFMPQEEVGKIQNLIRQTLSKKE